MKKCPACLAECADDALFCPVCGTDLSKINESEQAQPENSFCVACGNKLEPGALFCPRCGKRQSAAAAKAAVPGAVPEIFSDFAKTGKTFFTKGPSAAVENAAGLKSPMWALYGGLAVLLFMLSVPTFLFEFVMRTATRVMDGIGIQILSAVRDVYSWGVALLWSFLLGVFVYFAISFAIFGAVKLIHKKDVKLFSVFNMVSVASVPVSCVMLLNMLFGLLWMPLVILFTALGCILSFVLLYDGMNALADFGKKPALTFACCVGAVAFVVIITAGIVLSIKGKNDLPLMFIRILQVMFKI